jgi:hypothetical protein
MSSPGDDIISYTIFSPSASTTVPACALSFADGWQSLLFKLSSSSRTTDARSPLRVVSNILAPTRIILCNPSAIACVVRVLCRMVYIQSCAPGVVSTPLEQVSIIQSVASNVNLSTILVKHAYACSSAIFLGKMTEKRYRAHIIKKLCF